jgi:hypothetical protein
MVNQTQQGKLDFVSGGDCGENIWKMSCQLQGFFAVGSDHLPQRLYQRTGADANWCRLEVLGQEDCCIGGEGRVFALSDGRHPQLCWNRELGCIR